MAEKLGKQKKEEIRKQHPQYGHTAIEVHHVMPKFRGGSDQPSNLRPVNLIEHALEHHIMAENPETTREMRTNYWAAKQIVRRMSPEQLNELNQRISSRVR